MANLFKTLDLERIITSAKPPLLRGNDITAPIRMDYAKPFKGWARGRNLSLREERGERKKKDSQ